VVGGGELRLEVLVRLVTFAARVASASTAISVTKG